ncbi:hypothetical protein POMI540_2314 [Schizosaccharomyces pombe]
MINLDSSSEPSIVTKQFSVEECLSKLKEQHCYVPMRTIGRLRLRKSSDQTGKKCWKEKLMKIRSELEELWEQSMMYEEQKELTQLGEMLDRLWDKHINSEGSKSETISDTAISGNDDTMEKRLEQFSDDTLQDTLETEKNLNSKTSESLKSPTLSYPFDLDSLDKRIFKLESKIGYADEPLSELLNKCMEKLEIVEQDPQFWQSRIESWKQLLAKDFLKHHERNLCSIEKQTTLKNSSLKELCTEEDIVIMLEICSSQLPFVEQYMPILPLLLERLKSLQNMHTDAAEAISSWQGSKDVMMTMQSELNEWKNTVERLDHSKFYTQSVEEMRRLSDTVTQLEKRVLKLQ